MRRTSRGGNSTKLLSVISTVTLALIIIYSNVLVATVPLFHLAHAAVGKSSSTLTSPALLATSGDNVYVTWSSNKTGNWEISFRASNDGGKTFGEKINLSNDTSDSKDPQISASGNNIYVTWWDTIDKKTELKKPIMRVSNDKGKTFGEEIKVSDK